jgi:putative ABC transport system permease protein
MKEELKLIMRKQRTLKPAEPDDFALNQASMIIKGIEQIFGVINFAGWIIGAFSILVGGFGIANIMFVTVRERTNQIGIQKAVGAKRFFILVEFLSESVLLSLAGGLIGLFLVFLISMLAKFGFDVNIVMNFGNVMLGVLLSVIIGVVSGLVPAWFAARLDPVKAINTAF